MGRHKPVKDTTSKKALLKFPPEELVAEILRLRCTEKRFRAVMDVLHRLDTLKDQDIAFNGEDWPNRRERCDE